MHRQAEIMTQLNIFTRTVAWCICFLVFLHLGYARKNELKQNPTVTPTTYSVLVGTQPLLVRRNVDVMRHTR